MDRIIKPSKSCLLFLFDLLSVYKLYLRTYLFYTGLFGCLIIDYLFQNFYQKSVIQHESAPLDELTNVASISFCSDCQQKSLELIKIVENVKKGNDKLQHHFNQVMKHHIKQTCQNPVGELTCPICFRSFNFGDAHRSPVKLNCIHVVCYDCAWKWQEERNRQNQAPVCPLGCNREYRCSELGYVI